MVKVTIEVSKVATRYKVAVQAESIQRALEIVGGLNPGSTLRVSFPIDPETFFVEGSAAAGQTELEKSAA